MLVCATAAPRIAAKGTNMMSPGGATTTPESRTSSSSPAWLPARVRKRSSAPAGAPAGTNFSLDIPIWQPASAIDSATGTNALVRDRMSVHRNAAEEELSLHRVPLHAPLPHGADERVHGWDERRSVPLAGHPRPAHPLDVVALHRQQ